MSVFAARVSRIGTENAFKIGPRIAEVEEKGRRVIRCNLGEPDFALPAHITEAVKAGMDEGLTHYCDPQGLLELREAIAAHVAETRGIPVSADRVVVFPGGKPAIGLVEEGYVDPGDEVIYPSPGYPIYESFTGWVGARPVPLHLPEEQGFAFGAEELRPLLSERTKLLVLCFPSNPTGGVATRAQLEAIAALIEEKAPEGLRIYSDEIYEDIIFDGERHESIASIPGMASRTIIASGVSKSFAWTGGRVGWAVFPCASEADVFRNLNINYFSCVAPDHQRGAAVALRSPETRSFIKEMVSSFERRRDLVAEGLAKIPGVRCQRPKGAFYAFPNVSGVVESLGILDAYRSMSEEERARSSPATLLQLFLLYEHGVATVDRRSFGAIGAEGQHFLRLSTASSEDDLKEALSRIGDAASDDAGFRRYFEEGGPRF